MNINSIPACGVLVLLLLSACTDSQQNMMVGTLERERIELKVETNEPIVARHVIDGAEVQAGDILLQQDTTRLQARLEQVSAQRDQSAARLAELQRGPRVEEIQQTRARLAAADAQTVNARSDLARIRELFNQGLSSKAVLDRAEAAYKSSNAEEDAIRQSLAALLNGTTPEELMQAEAALAAATAQVSQLELDIQRSQIIAPVPGQLEKLLYQVGERPAAGATVAVILADARVYARVYVPEPWRANITPGTTLEVQVDGVNGTLKGTVRWVSADASFTPYFALTEHDRSRLSYLAEIDLPEAAAELPSGLPLVVFLPTQKSQP